MADSAGRTRSTALCTERGIWATVSVPAIPSRANRASMMPFSASLLRLMAKSQSKGFQST
jgi:hypothetical protein